VESEFRPLNSRERGIIERLLEAEFQGHDELRMQIDSVTAKQVLPDGTLRLQCASGPPAPTKYAIAMEGTYTDADGGAVAILLHVDTAGFMRMLEILKHNGSPIIEPPVADSVTVLR
jgi:hypothetical protein